MDAEAFNRIERALELIFEYLKEQMIAELQRQGHSVTDVLINSIERKITQFADVIRMEGSFVVYGQWVDRGRRPGTKKVPIEALEDWIKRKGFESDAKAIRGMAFAIQTSIFKKGISQPDSWRGTDTANFMTATLDKNEKQIEDDICSE